MAGQKLAMFASMDDGKMHETKRAMHTRHLMMIAIGGTIGTGIFLSVGYTIAVAGPGSVILSYAIVGLFVLPVMTVLGEMAAMYPVSGAFSVFGTRFVSPALGFTVGWNYWFRWSLSIPSELTAAALILQYWAPQLHAWHWVLIITVPAFLIQLVHVRIYGESEYWCALVKVLMIVVFIIVGLVYDAGLLKGHPGPGLSNFQTGQAFIGGFAGFAQTYIYAFYSYSGIELSTVAAGEARRPYKSVPRAIKATLLRVILFYILTILTIGLCINPNDPSLLSAASTSDLSPFTIVFRRAGFGAAAQAINAVLLTAVLSATNSYFYASSRMLLSLARSGQAPRIFGWVNSRGVPVPALLASLAVSFLTFLTTIWGESTIFTWLMNMIGISTLLVWGSIGFISFRFRKAYEAQGRSLSDLPFRQYWFPVLPYGIFVLALLMFAAEIYAAVKSGTSNVIATLIGVAIYIVIYGGYTFYERFYLKQRQHLVPLLQVDLDSDAVWVPGRRDAVRELDRVESAKEREADGSIKRWWKRFMSWHIY